MDPTKNSWPLWNNASCSGMGTSQDLQALPRHLSRALCKVGEEGAERENGGKITSVSGQAWDWATPWEKQRKERNGEDWLSRHVVPQRSTRLWHRQIDRWLKYRKQGLIPGYLALEVDTLPQGQRDTDRQRKTSRGIRQRKYTLPSQQKHKHTVALYYRTHISTKLKQWTCDTHKNAIIKRRNTTFCYTQFWMYLIWLPRWLQSTNSHHLTFFKPSGWKLPTER